MGHLRNARLWHGLTGLVGAFGLVAQLVLVITGGQVVVGDEPFSLGQRLLHFFSYFTVLSNGLVLAAALTLLRRPARDGRVWRVLRLSGLTGIIVTGIVHWFFLRPLLDLSGWSYGVDKVLHVAVPLLALLSWVAFGPRPRVNGRVFALSLIYPVAWLVYTLVMGAATGWFPYPFLDVDENGAVSVTVVCVALTGAICLVGGSLWWGDQKLRPAPAEPTYAASERLETGPTG